MAANDYRGSAGYHRMHTELVESLYSEFPEAVGRIFVVNRLNDSTAELERAAQYLGIPNLIEAVRAQRNKPDFPQGQDGEAIPITRPDGTIVTLAFGWDPSRYRNAQGQPVALDDLGPEEIQVLAGLKLHEFAHALYRDDFIASANQHGADSLPDYMIRRLGESRADGFRADVIARNTGDTSYLYHLAATYDQGSRIDPQAANRSTPRAQQILVYRGENEYDGGDEMLEIARRYHGNREREIAPRYPESYRFTGLRDSYERVNSVFQQSPDNQPAFAYFLRANGVALEAGISSMQQADKSPQEMREWVNAHPELFYGVGQSLAAQAYLDNPQARRYEQVSPQVTSLEQAVGQAMQPLSDLRRVAGEPMVAAFLEKMNNPQTVLAPELQGEIFRRLRMDSPNPSSRPENYTAFINAHPILKARIDALRANGTPITMSAIFQALQGLTFDRSLVPQADAQELWDILRQASGTDSIVSQGRDMMWRYIGQLSGDPQRTASPQAVAAWTMWQQLVSSDNLALGQGRGLTTAQAAKAFLRLPPQTIEQLANGTPITELMPQVQALLATREFAEIRGTSVLTTTTAPRSNERAALTPPL